MKLYEVRADIKGHPRIAYDNFNEYVEIVKFFSTGLPNKENILFKGYLSNNGYQYRANSYTDCPYLNNNVLVVTQKALDCFGKFITGFCDVIDLPILHAKTKYYALNVFLIDYIFQTNPVGFYTKVNSSNEDAELGLQAGTKVPIIFKLEHTKSTKIYCTKDFIDLVRMGGLVGFWFGNFQMGNQNSRNIFLK